MAGVVLGVGAALELTQLMTSLLFHTRATDPATYLTVALLFLVMALLASYLPARRAAKIDPVRALRA